MPSHPKKKSKTDVKQRGGPLQRSGPKAKQWDDIIGPSIDCIPGHQLPLVKTVLQCYRALRIEDPLGSTYELAEKITNEVIAIWDRARVPTSSHRACIAKVVQAIQQWKAIHNPGEGTSSHTFNLLLDLAPKLRGRVSEEMQLEHLKMLMRQESHMKRHRTDGSQFDWEVEFQFYINQLKVIIVLWNVRDDIHYF